MIIKSGILFRLYGEVTEPPSFNDGDSESEHKLELLRARLAHLYDEKWGRIFSSFKESDIVEWTLEDLQPADVTIKHLFDFNDTEPIDMPARRMSPRHNDFVHKELDNMLDVGVIIGTTSPWKFHLMISTKKYGSLDSACTFVR